MTLHALSGGRFSAGLGSGSTRADFEAVGADYEQRFHMLAEALPAIRRLCQGERVGAAYLAPWADRPVARRSSSGAGTAGCGCAARRATMTVGSPPGFSRTSTSWAKASSVFAMRGARAHWSARSP